MERFVKIFTYGCQMNDLDTLKMYSELAHSGWSRTDDTHQADLIVLNTCSVRQKAYEKVLSNLGRLRKYKRFKPGLVIAVAGCVAQQAGVDLHERMPHIDIVLGTHQLHRLPDLVDSVLDKRGAITETAYGDSIPSLDIVPDAAFVQPAHRTFINIMQGCNNYCTYCIVPYVRGREISRDHHNILAEVALHASRGVKEVFLLGQNVNSYAGGVDFARLLRLIAATDGIERIRFTTSHSKDMHPQLIACFGDLPKLCNYIHLPFQSGSNKVLNDMNRNYTKEHYLDLIDGLRTARADMTFSTDVIVGFPGETEHDFEETLAVIRRVRYDLIYSFKYSPRPGTRAAELIDDVPAEEKSRRLSVLQELQKEITLENFGRRIGTTCDVLVDSLSSRSPLDVCGRNTQFTIVNFPGDESLIGQTVPVRITRANPNSLTGQPA